MNQRMVRAHELTDVLAIERVRWQERVHELESRVRLLIGDALLSAAAINYFGPFNSEFRFDLINDFQTILTENEIQFSKTYHTSSVLSNPSEIRAWISQQLPDDQCSM